MDARGYDFLGQYGYHATQFDNVPALLFVKMRERCHPIIESVRLAWPIS
jgi:hypothetical protein